MKKVSQKGFLSWQEWGSRLTETTANGLRSVDLGCITIGEAEKKAYIHKAVLLVDGRVYRKGARV